MKVLLILIERAHASKNKANVSAENSVYFHQDTSGIKKGPKQLVGSNVSKLLLDVKKRVMDVVYERQNQR